jgi:hypothetical protein
LLHGPGDPVNGPHRVVPDPALDRRGQVREDLLWSGPSQTIELGVEVG